MLEVGLCMMGGPNLDHHVASCAISQSIPGTGCFQLPALHPHAWRRRRPVKDSREQPELSLRLLLQAASTEIQFSRIGSKPLL